MKPCKNCIHHTACVTANPDMVKKTFECEHFEDKEKIKTALEKQIPKKPVIEGKYKLKHCPCCWENGELGYFESLIDKGAKHCRRCGQALDRSEEE